MGLASESDGLLILFSSEPIMTSLFVRSSVFMDFGLTDSTLLLFSSVVAPEFEGILDVVTLDKASCRVVESAGTEVEYVLEGEAVFADKFVVEVICSFCWLGSICTLCSLS